VTVFVVTGKPGTPGAAMPGSNFIEAKYADKNHAHDRSGKKKRLPTGLKGDTLHVRLPAILVPRT
jgi:hypothetical protein